MNVDLVNSSDLRSFLKSVFERRRSIDPGYSQRKFADDLGLTPAYLSFVLAGRNGLSRANVARLSLRLDLSAEEKDYLWALVESEFGRSQVSRDTAKAKSEELRKHLEVNRVSLDVFRTISDWYHLGILELLTTKNFSYDIPKIAMVMGIREDQARGAIDRLSRLKMVVWGPEGLRPSTEADAVDEKIPSAVIRAFHKQILAKAIEGIDAQPIEKRNFNSSVLAIRLADIPKAKERIEKFAREFNAEFGVGDQKDEVYCMSTQFFSLQTEIVQ